MDKLDLRISALVNALANKFDMQASLCAGIERIKISLDLTPARFFYSYRMATLGREKEMINIIKHHAHMRKSQS
jgi:ribosome-binding factor A